MIENKCCGKCMTDNEIRKAFKVLESWLWRNYHNATDTDKERAKLYKAVQIIFNAKKIPEMFALAKAEAYKECIEVDRY